VLLIAATLVLTPAPRAARAGGYTWISVDVESRRVSGDGWMPNSTVTLTFSHPQVPARTTTITHQMGGQPSFSLSVRGRFAVRPGDTVVATDGMTTKSLVVGPIALITSDESADRIWGNAPPGETVVARVSGTSKQVSTVSTSLGIWVVDFTGVYDLVTGTTVDFRERDSDWDETFLSADLPVDPDVDDDTINNSYDNCQWDANVTQYDGDGDGAGAVCDDVDRLSGTTRYGTAAAVSAAAFEKSDEVFIALGTNFPDALVAAAAAGHWHSPVLLTRPDHLPQATADELARLHPSEIYIIGGDDVLYNSVAQELAAYAPTVTRIAGDDRYATAAAVADRIFGCYGRPLLAYGRNFPDALVAAAAGGHLKSPVLLVEHDMIPASTMHALHNSLSPGAWIVGGSDVVDDSVFNAVP
jgi:hypothetical protein